MGPDEAPVIPAIPGEGEATAARFVTVPYSGERTLKAELILGPEKELIEFKASISRYSELVIAGVPGFIFCAVVDALREPTDYRGWVMVVILATIVGAGIFLRQKFATEVETPDPLDVDDSSMRAP